MKGLQIFLHSARMVLNNLGDAFRVSAVLYAVQVLGQVVVFLTPAPETVVQDGVAYPVTTPGLAMQNLVFGLIAVIASLWIAVAWHRYVLANEPPQGWLPRWHGRELLGYLGRTLMLAVIIVLAVLALALPAGVLGQAVPALSWVIAMFTVGFGSYLFFRLGAILPAAAIGEHLPLRDAWVALKGETGTLLALAGISMVVAIVVQLPTILSGDPNSLISLIYSIVVNWFVTLIGISVLTTLYGHYIEQRPID